jgi:hypothetical protein
VTLRSIEWMRVSYAMAAIAAVAYGFWSYFGYALIRDQLRLPDDQICSGRTGCVSEITIEHYADFLLKAFIGVPFVFLIAFGLCVALFGIITTLFDRRYSRG